MTVAIETMQAAGGDRLAVVAVGADFPGCQTLNGFYKAIYAGADLTQPAAGWKPFGSMKRAAESAARAAANLELGLLMIGPAGELNRVRSLVTGPVVDYAGYSEPLPAMLVQAHEWLEAQVVQAVLIAGGSISSAAGANAPAFGFDQAVMGSRPGSGAVGLVLMRLSDAQRRNQPVLGVIDALTYYCASRPVVGSGQKAPDAQMIQACATAALLQGGVLPAQVGILEALASGEAGLDEVEIRGLNAAYREPRLSTLLGSLRAQTGWLEGCNGLASLARAAVCLAYQVRPGTRGWSGPKHASLWAGSSFYVLPESLTWFQPAGPMGRRAAVSALGKDGSCAHLLLAEAEMKHPAEAQPSTGRDTPRVHRSGEAQPSTGCDTPRARRSGEAVMRDAGQTLLMVGGATAAEIVRDLEVIKTRLENGEALEELALQAYTRVNAAAQAQLAVILAHHSAEALRELDYALRGLPTAAEKGSEWQTPLGSYYTPRPLGGNSPVAFVYPGAFNSYLGAGKDLFALFPAMQNRLAQIAPVGSVLCEEQLYPRSLTPLAKDQMDRLEAALLDDAFSMMSSGLSLSVVQTMVFRDIFQVQPASAFGYSLGENSMLFSMGVWGDGEATSQRLHNSPLFRTRLAGPQNAVREHWGLPAQSAVKGGEELWGNFLLMAAVERVEQALVTEPRVYLTHINTPRQVVIAGDPAACRRVIEGLKCSSLRAPFNYVLHCQVMESEFAALYDLHRWPVREKPAARLYSAADDQPFQWTEAEVARAVARDLCSRLDFPRLIETVYADGARIFIELGAGSNCSKWIEDTLRGRPFLSMSANRKGVDDTSAILRVLARLASHRAAVNLDPLFIGQVNSYG